MSNIVAHKRWTQAQTANTYFHNNHFANNKVAYNYIRQLTCISTGMFSNSPCVSVPILLQLSTNSQILILSITIQAMYKHYERCFLSHKQHRFMQWRSEESEPGWSNEHRSFFYREAPADKRLMICNTKTNMLLTTFFINVSPFIQIKLTM